MVKTLGFELLMRSPFARMIAVLFVEFLVRKGYLASEDASQAVEDAINIIGFGAMAATLLIWQWRNSHPAKAQLDVIMPIAEGTPQEMARTEKKMQGMVKRLFSSLFVDPAKTPQQ